METQIEPLAKEQKDNEPIEEPTPINKNKSIDLENFEKLHLVLNNGKEIVLGSSKVRIDGLCNLAVFLKENILDSNGEKKYPSYTS